VQCADHGQGRAAQQQQPHEIPHRQRSRRGNGARAQSDGGTNERISVGQKSVPSAERPLGIGEIASAGGALKIRARIKSCRLNQIQAGELESYSRKACANEMKKASQILAACNRLETLDFL
jgi:hypothetical protein